MPGGNTNPSELAVKLIEELALLRDRMEALCNLMHESLQVQQKTLEKLGDIEEGVDAQFTLACEVAKASGEPSVLELLNEVLE